MAAPKKAETEERQAVYLRIPRPLYRFIVEQAAKERRTINGEVIMALENWARLKDPNSLHPVNQRRQPKALD